MNIFFKNKYELNRFSLDIYNTMMEYDEMWFVTKNGYAFQIADASLMDC